MIDSFTVRLYEGAEIVEEHAGERRERALEILRDLRARGHDLPMLELYDDYHRVEIPRCEWIDEI